jgi:hypothetical protein
LLSLLDATPHGSSQGYPQRQQQPFRPTRGVLRRRSSSDDRWEVVSNPGAYEESSTLPPPTSRSASHISLPPGAGAPLSSPHTPRSVSPFGMAPSAQYSHSTITSGRTEKEKKERDLAQTVRKKPPTPSGPVAILSSLDPPSKQIQQPPVEEYALPAGMENMLFNVERRPSHRDSEKKEKKGFLWSGKEKAKEKEREKERERPRERERDRDRERTDDELTRMIGASSTLSIMMEHSSICRRAGYSTASSVEDWALALEICERASANEANAKEAATALRREFKYGEPPSQLSAARVHLHFFYYLQS